MCQCGRPIPEGVCPYCDLQDGIGLDLRGGYGGEPEGTYAARVMAWPMRRVLPRMRALVARRAEKAAAPALAGEGIRRAT